MSTVDRPDIAKLQEDLGPVVTEPIKNPFETPGITPRGPKIKTPDGVPMNTAQPVATGAPANEIVIETPVVVIRFTRGRCVFKDPIGALIAINDAPSKAKDEASFDENASLSRAALTATATIELDKVDENNPDAGELTFTETRAISEALVKWSLELGKP